MKKIDFKTQQAKKLPSPVPGVIVTVPLDLLPAYLKVNNITPNGYNEQDEILSVKRLDAAHMPQKAG